MEKEPRNSGEQGGTPLRTNADIIDRINDLEQEIAEREAIIRNHKGLQASKNIVANNKQMLDGLERERDNLAKELQENIFNNLMENKPSFRNKINDYNSRMSEARAVVDGGPQRGNVVAHRKYQNAKAELERLERESNDYIMENVSKNIADIADVEMRDALPVSKEEDAADLSGTLTPEEIDALLGDHNTDIDDDVLLNSETLPIDDNIDSGDDVKINPEPLPVDNGEDGNETSELEPSAKELILKEFGAETLKMMNLDVSANREQMAERIAKEQLRREQESGKYGKGNGIFYINAIRRGLRFHKLTKEALATIDRENDVYAEAQRDEKGNIIYDENGNEILKENNAGDYIMHRYMRYAEGLVDDEIGEHTEDGVVFKNEKDRDAVRYALMDVYNGVYKYRDADGSLSEEGRSQIMATFNEALDKAGIGGNLQISNFAEMAEKVMGMAGDLAKNADGYTELDNYLNENMSLFSGSVKTGINSKVKLNNMTAVVAAAGIGGGIGYYLGSRKWRQVVKGGAVAALGMIPGIAVGAAVGAVANTVDRIRTGISEADEDRALGRNNKSALNINYDFDISQIDESLKDTEIAKTISETDRAGAISALINDYIERGEDGNVVFKDGANKNELADIIAMTRARFDVGAAQNLDLISYQVDGDDSLGKIEEQKDLLNREMMNAMRLLRQDGQEQLVIERQEAFGNMIAREVKTARSATNILRKNGKMIAKSAAAGAITALAVTGAFTLGSAAAENLGITDRLNSLLEREPRVEGTAGDATSPELNGDAGNYDYINSIETTKVINGDMSHDNIVYVPARDADGNIIPNTYNVFDNMADPDSADAGGLFRERGITIEFDENNNLTEDSIRKIQEAYSTDSLSVGEPFVREVNIPGGEAMVGGTGGTIEGQNLVENITRVDGAVTTMNASDIRDGGDNWVINVWDRGQGATLNDNTKYFFQVGSDRNNIFSYDVDQTTGQVIIPKDSLVGRELIQDVDGDGKMDVLGSVHGVMEMNNETGEAITQASLPGNNSVTFEQLRETYGSAPETTVTSPDTGETYIFPSGDNDGLDNDIIIRSPRQVYSGAVEGNEAIADRMELRTEGYGRTIELRDNAVDYDNGLEIHQVERVGGYSITDDALAAGPEEKLKTFYEGAPINFQNGTETVDMYESRVFDVDKFNALSEADKDTYAAQAMQELANRASGNGVKAESWGSLFNVADKGGRTLEEINEAGGILNTGSDVAYDTEVNRIMSGVQNKLREFADAGFRPQIKIIPTGGTNSSEYMGTGIGGRVRELFSSINMRATEPEAYVSLTGANGELMKDFDSEMTESFVKAVGGIPRGAEIDDIGFKLGCNQPVVVWHMPEGSTPVSTITETAIQEATDTMVQETVPVETITTVETIPGEEEITTEDITTTTTTTTTTTNTTTSDTANSISTGSSEDTPTPEEPVTPRPITQPEQPETPPEQPVNPPTTPVEDEGLTPKNPVESANMGNENINYNADVNSDNVLGEDQFDSSREFNRETGRFEDINATGTDNPAATAEGGFDQSGAARVSTTLTDDQQAAQAAADTAQAEADNNFESQAATASEAIEQGQASIAAEQEASNFMDSYQGPADWADDAGDDVSASDFADSGGLGEATEEGES